MSNGGSVIRCKKKSVASPLQGLLKYDELKREMGINESPLSGEEIETVTSADGEASGQQQRPWNVPEVSRLYLQ